MYTQTEPYPTNITAQEIINKLRIGDLSAFLEFSRYVREKYKTNNPEQLMCYGVLELLSTDLRDSDIVIAKLFSFGLDENAYFLEEYELKNGSAEFLNSAQAAIILKQNPEFETIMSNKENIEQIASTIEKYRLEIIDLDRNNDMGPDSKFSDEKNVIKKSFDTFELKIILTEYQRLLIKKIEEDPYDTTIIKRLDFITGALKTLSSELSSDDRNKLMTHVNKFINSTHSDDPKEISILGKFKNFFLRIFDKRTYHEIIEKRSDAQQFCECREKYKRIIIDPQNQIQEKQSHENTAESESYVSKILPNNP